MLRPEILFDFWVGLENCAWLVPYTNTNVLSSKAIGISPGEEIYIKEITCYQYIEMKILFFFFFSFSAA